MDIFNFTFMLVMIFGFIIIIFALIKINKFDKSPTISSLDESLEEVKNALNQADIAIEDLNFISEEMFSQFEKKQKELLFLYEAIEKKRLDSSKKSTFDIQLEKFSPIKNDNQKLEYNNNFNHPLMPKIKELLNKNYTFSEIAKELNIGQGELEFIINIGME